MKEAKGMISGRRLPVAVHVDEDAVGRAVASIVADQMEHAWRGQEKFYLGCPGGRSPVSTYAALAAESRARSFDLSRLVIVMMDDYVVKVGGRWRHVPFDAHNSCRRFARHEIQGMLNSGIPRALALPDENVWFPNPEDPRSYDDRIEDAGGIDHFLLASGAGDGHVAFNPPGSSPDSKSRIVELAEQTRRDNLATFPDFPSLDAVPTHGVTVGIATIAKYSKTATMILVGRDKRVAFERLTVGLGYDSDWPASVCRVVPGAELHCDAHAASSFAPLSARGASDDNGREEG